MSLSPMVFDSRLDPALAALLDAVKAVPASRPPAVVRARVMARTRSLFFAALEAGEEQPPPPSVSSVCLVLLMSLLAGSGVGAIIAALVGPHPR